MKREELRDILRDLAKANGGQLSAELVVEEATNENSPLHGQFPWDNDTAAHAYRLSLARQMIRSVRFEVRTEKFSFDKIPVYVHDPTSDVQSYVSLENASAESKRSILLSELERVGANLQRAEKIAAATMPGLLPDLGSLANGLLAIMAKVKRARPGVA